MAAKSVPESLAKFKERYVQYILATGNKESLAEEHFTGVLEALNPKKGDHIGGMIRFKDVDDVLSYLIQCISDFYSKYTYTPKQIATAIIDCHGDHLPTLFKIPNNILLYVLTPINKLSNISSLYYSQIEQLVSNRNELKILFQNPTCYNKSTYGNVFFNSTTFIGGQLCYDIKLSGVTDSDGAIFKINWGIKERFPDGTFSHIQAVSLSGSPQSYNLSSLLAELSLRSIANNPPQIVILDCCRSIDLEIGFSNDTVRMFQYEKVIQILNKSFINVDDYSYAMCDLITSVDSRFKTHELPGNTEYFIKTHIPPDELEGRLQAFDDNRAGLPSLNSSLSRKGSLKVRNEAYCMSVAFYILTRSRYTYPINLYFLSDINELFNKYCHGNNVIESYRKYIETHPILPDGTPHDYNLLLSFVIHYYQTLHNEKTPYDSSKLTEFIYNQLPKRPLYSVILNFDNIDLSNINIVELLIKTEICKSLEYLSIINTGTVSVDIRLFNLNIFPRFVKLNIGYNNINTSNIVNAVKAARDFYNTIYMNQRAYDDFLYQCQIEDTFNRQQTILEAQAAQASQQSLRKLRVRTSASSRKNSSTGKKRTRRNNNRNSNV
jgi:hypothetical protein